ncbi:23S rRNA (adenine(1618)-N(6))-methyltransferase RlmF [uncultured Lacinutrix sp.]|uniref:23S rRNA (adenine(1618)-N(6))-methyltransferase RlmF n=1 Tax=uncultured Lacinutrix sp. TaxID=574032 RepID=UPI00262EE9B1|nr:23S rRNA (adenine(1618)-N(6))-methyltransferase RlmF [uncultured Lacinutrix sp.]
MHKNNKHKKGYDFEKLIEVTSKLEPFVSTNQYGNKTIDFANPKAVKLLNTALLKLYYNISFWEFPDDNLCPPIPGRVDYIHHINDLLKTSNINNNINVLDIGTGANCIYPLLGYAEYNWNFLATDCNKKSIAFAKAIINQNKLESSIKLNFQQDKSHIFEGVLNGTNRFAVTMCNPPFYKNEAEALAVTTSKLKGLGKLKDSPIRNFGGEAHELWYNGGEKAFLHTYLYESSLHKDSCFWYTTLVSNKDNVKSMYKSLTKLGATTVNTIAMDQGNKKSRVVAWTFLNKKEQTKWTKQNN